VQEIGKIKIVEEADSVNNQSSTAHRDGSFLLNHLRTAIIEHLEDHVQNFQQLHLRVESRHFAHLVEDEFCFFLVNFDEILQLSLGHQTCEIFHDAARLSDDHFVLSLQQ
jgi:hypothetical protein